MRYLPVIMLSDLQASGASYSVYGVLRAGREKVQRPGPGEGGGGPVQEEGAHLARQQTSLRRETTDARPETESKTNV